MYKLTFSPASPYVRKVVIAAHLAGINNELVLLKPDDELFIKIKSQNPLGKIPVLLTPKNDFVFDSRVIIDYFNNITGKLYPVNYEKILVKTNSALVEGIIDAALLYVYSIRYSGQENPSVVWQNHLLKKIENALNEFEKKVFDLFPIDNLYASHIGLIVALDYLNFRSVYEWETGSKNLLNWHKEVSNILPGYYHSYPK